MVHGAGARPRGLARRRVERDPPAPRVAPDLPHVPVAALGAHQALEEQSGRLRAVAVRAHALEAAERELGRDLGVNSDERRIAALVDDELVPEPLEVREPERSFPSLDGDSLGREPVGPEAERLRRADAPDDAVHHPGARPSGNRPRVLEEGEVRAGASDLVAVEQVVDARVVLVDRLRGEAKPQHPRVEVDVPRRVARDRSDVVDAVESHLVDPFSSVTSQKLD